MVAFFVSITPYFSPSAKAKSNRPHILISGILPDEFRIEKLPNINDGGGSILLYRSHEGRLIAWYLPTRNNQYLMPDIIWGRIGYLCNDFGLDSEDTFRCLDTELESYEWGKREFRWDKKGNNLGNRTEDMLTVQGREHLGYFVVEGLGE